MPKLSVIIPTHKRSDILAKSMTHLGAQTVVKDIEVIVVSDGPDEDTALLFTNYEWPMPVTYLDIPKSQQGVARNAGIESATGNYCLFIGDDIFLAPDACEKHLEAQKKHNCAVLGFTTWDPECGITPVMTWLEQSGWQFGYPLIQKYSYQMIPSNIQHQFSYTSHLSLSLDIAKKHQFRKDMTMYGWEDIEWGTRLKNDGVSLLYEPDAKALHHHHITLEESLLRMETLGKSARLEAQKNPQFDRAPTGIKLLAYQILSLLPTMSGKHRKAFLKGYQNFLL